MIQLYHSALSCYYFSRPRLPSLPWRPLSYFSHYHRLKWTQQTFKCMFCSCGWCFVNETIILDIIKLVLLAILMQFFLMMEVKLASMDVK